MDKKFIISPSPHIHSGNSVEGCMYGVLIALIPAFLVALYFFGLGALIVTVTSVLACVLFEYLIQKYILKGKVTISNGSAILTGVLLAFNVPSNLPVWIIIIGALVAIGIGKMSFGGLGNNIFNPALVGRVFLLISFPVQMTTWPKPEAFNTHYLDATTGATPLSMLKQGMPIENTTLDLLLGNVGGSLGEIGAIALLLGFAYMLWKKNHYMAHSCVDIGNRRNFLSFNRHRSYDPTSYRRAVIRIDIHGYRLCYITDVSQRNDYLWCCHRSLDNHYPPMGCLS